MPRSGLVLPTLMLLACATVGTSGAAPAPPPSPPAAPARAPARPPARPVEPPPPQSAAASLRDRVVDRAASAVGAPTLSRVTREVSDDCTGFARWAYRAGGEDLLEGSVSNMALIATRARALRRGGRPRPGDLVFFRETYDRNRDRRRDDGVTHVGVVERVEPDGTVVFAHRATSGVKESRMNLRFPSRARADDGRVLNDYIRRGSGKQRGKLTGEQFAGFGDLDLLYRSRAGGAVAVSPARSGRGAPASP
ncbi:MAG TPA: CHAP domain-containing protein [Myxococcales bacterium]|nr:CHAP domain-containing protein [Myxococcales bacterium]